MTDKLTPQQILNESDTIVIKVGSALVCDIDENSHERTPRKAWFAALARDIKILQDNGKKVVIVTSGGIALGRDDLNIPRDMPTGDILLSHRQAASGIGQPIVYAQYHEALKTQGIKTAQGLLTRHDIKGDKSRHNAIEALAVYMDNNIVPILNENDLTATAEIKFGDNDTLAAHIAGLVNADSIILLSSIRGLYKGNPELDDNAEFIPLVTDIDAVKEYAGEALSSVSTGGMISKVSAAEIATKHGIHLVLADGRPHHCIKNIIDATGDQGTVFLADTQEKAVTLTTKGKRTANIKPHSPQPA